LIRILPVDELPPPVLQSQKQWIPLDVNESGFEIGPDIIRGTLNLKQRECVIRVHKEFFSLPLLNVFQSFLYLLYHTLCFERSIKSSFIHGCGVIKEGTGYLFIGYHQSGKTTIGELSDGLVIHDDQIIITLDQEGYTMDSPPLPGKLRHHPDKPCSIDRIYAIVQNTRISVKQLSPDLALKSLYNEIVSPLTLLSSDENIARIKKAKSCFEVLKLLPVYELHFDKKGEFWETLANLQ